MSNTGTLTATMPGLWKEEAFWGFFSQESVIDKAKADILLRLIHEHQVCLTLETQIYVKNLMRHVPIGRLREIFKDDFLEKPFLYPTIQCVLKDKEPDSVTTIFRYSTDERLATALGEIFPEREIKCEWFIDGMGDYGSYSMLNRQIHDEESGNLQEDLAKADGFYCVCQQRDPDRNPGNTPCPDTDKCHLCGKMQK